MIAASLAASSYSAFRTASSSDAQPLDLLLQVRQVRGLGLVMLRQTNRANRPYKTT